jgi:hypothetical protein
MCGQATVISHTAYISVESGKESDAFLSEMKLIGTDTTLDLSQNAESV